MRWIMMHGLLENELILGTFGMLVMHRVWLDEFITYDL